MFESLFLSIFNEIYFGKRSKRFLRRKDEDEGEIENSSLFRVTIFC